jgi:dolichol kinase
LLHAASAALALLALVSLPTLRFGALGVAVAALAFEAARLRMPGFSQWMAARIPVFRPREATRMSGAAWLAVGYALAAWLPPPGPVAGILAGALADPAASWVGGKWGGGRKKSWPGTIAAGTVTAVAFHFPGLSRPAWRGPRWSAGPARWTTICSSPRGWRGWQPCSLDRPAGRASE